MNQAMGSYYRTNEYGMFRKLLGNRDVSKDRENSIRKSILERGYICSPIIVNERMEVIDGQGRLSVLQSMQMPVDYIKVEGLTVEDCVSMNISGGNWTTKDYIDSYVDRGYTDYILLKNLMRDHMDIHPSLLFRLLHITVREIKSGSLSIGTNEINLLNQYLKYIGKISNQKFRTNNRMMIAFTIALEFAGLDIDRLVSVIDSDDPLGYPTKVEECLKVMETLYNKGQRVQKRFYFLPAYDHYKAWKLANNLGWSEKEDSE